MIEYFFNVQVSAASDNLINFIFLVSENDNRKNFYR